MERIKEKLQRLSEEYKYSNRIYNKYYNYVNIPSIILTSSASIFSYLNTSEMMPADYRNYITLITALLTSFSTMLQTISSSCEFNVKRTKFREAANQCDHLIDKVFFEMQNANEENFIDKIESEIEKIKNNCKFLPLQLKNQNLI